MSLHCALYFTPIPLYGPALCANLFGSRYENTPMFEVTTPLWQEVYFQDAYTYIGNETKFYLKMPPLHSFITIASAY